MPPAVLHFVFTRYSDNGRRLVVALTINPELTGFKRETESWGRNPWNKSQSFKDPAKKKFIDDLGVWGVEFAKQMDVAFDKKKDAFSNIQSWRSVMNKKTDSVSAPSAVAAPVSLDEKLRELKRLYDGGLITNDVYVDRQRKLLDVGI